MSLFDNYTMFCGGAGRAEMQTDITRESSDDEVRAYMFGKHNDRAVQGIHKAVVYRNDDPRIARAISPEMLGTVRNMGIDLPAELDEMVVPHAGLVVDTMSVKESRKYNESFSVRESVA